MAELIFGGVLALVCLLFGTIMGATLNEHASSAVDPYARAAATTPDVDLGPESDTALKEVAASYATGDINIHLVEIDGRYWVSTDPDLGEVYLKFLGGDIHRTIREYERETED